MELGSRHPDLSRRPCHPAPRRAFAPEHLAIANLLPGWHSRYWREAVLPWDRSREVPEFAKDRSWRRGWLPPPASCIRHPRGQNFHALPAPAEALLAAGLATHGLPSRCGSIG